jgi:hypothetical protein
MPNRLLSPAEQAPIQPRKGKRGYKRVGVDVSPEHKARLVQEARANNCSQSAVVRDALDYYFDGVDFAR